ncbi:hypothetical protein ACWEQ1_12675 [Streptomyces nodosus]
MGSTAETTQQQGVPTKELEDIQTHEGAGLHLHTRKLHPSLTIPYMTMGDVTSTAKDVTHSAKAATSRATSRVPGAPVTKDLVFYGGIGAMAVAGALEWPVALAVAGATYVLRGRRARQAGAEAPAGQEGGTSS